MVAPHPVEAMSTAFKLLPSPPLPPGVAPRDSELPPSPVPVPVPVPVYHEFGPHMISGTGQIVLWISFFLMFIPAVMFFMSMTRARAGRRKYHFYTFLINGIASVAYLTMACGYGWTIVAGRQLFYARYIDWMLTTPLQLIDLCGMAMVQWDSTQIMLGLDVLMIASGTIGALLATDHETYKRFLFYAVGVACYIPIALNLMFGYTSANSQSGQLLNQNIYAKSIYVKIAWLTVIMWTGYPIVWVFAEGTGVMSPDAEVVCYCVLDFVAKSVFGYIILCSQIGLDQVLDYEQLDTAPLLPRSVSKEPEEEWVKSSINTKDDRQYFYNKKTNEYAMNKPGVEEDEMPPPASYATKGPCSCL